MTTFQTDHVYADDNPTGTSSDVYPIDIVVTDSQGGVGTLGTSAAQSDIFSTHADGNDDWGPSIGRQEQAATLARLARSLRGPPPSIRTAGYTRCSTDSRAMRRLAIVNPATGAVTPVGSGVGTHMITLEVAADGTMYGVGYVDGELYRIDKSLGTATPIGNTGITAVMDLAFNSAGVLYATVANQLWTVNTATGASTPVGTIVSAMHIMGIMFDASDNLLATDYMPAAPLFAVNLTTLAAVVVGPTGFDFPHGGDIFVQTGVPAPLSVTVNNVAPTIHSAALSSASINEGESVTVTGSFSDPALGVVTEIFTGTATWSDGISTPVSIVGGTFSTTRTFADDNPSGTNADTFTVDISISDDDGGGGTPAVQSDIFSTHAGGTRLGTINRATGAGNDVGPFGTSATWAAAFDTDGRLFTLFDGFSGSARLGIVNQATGAVTPVGPGVGTNMITLEIAADGTMYGVGFDDRQLYRIDKTLGTATPIGDTGITAVMDLAFNSAGVLYATVENRLWTVNTATGASTPVGTISGAMHVMGIMFDASDNLLATDFMEEAPLFAVNLTTLAAVVVGPTGFDFPHGGDIFVQTGVPAPLSVTINNVAPTIDSAVLSSSSINEGESVTVTGSFSDPALGVSTETFTGTATWSDGVSTPVSIAGGTFSTTRTFADDDPSGTSADTFTVDISISDDDGGVGTLGTPAVQSDIFSTHAGGTRLGTINRATGAGSDIGPFGTFDTWAAAFDTDGTLFTLFDGFSGSARLGIVNQVTGAVTPVGSGVGTNMITLEVAADGTMYGVGYNDRLLYRIDKTLGTATPIGDTGIEFVMDLAINSAGVLYATVLNQLWTVNTATGASTPVGTISGAMHIMGIMFDASDNLLATDFMPAAPLFAVNLTTLAAVVVGPTGFDFPHGGDIFVQTGVPIVLSVTVNNVAPVILSLSATSVDENGLVTLSGTYSDTGTQDTHTLTIDWGEGPVTLPLPVSGGSFSFTHQYLDDNPSGTASDLYTIGVTLTDDDTGTDVEQHHDHDRQRRSGDPVTLSATSVDENGTRNPERHLQRPGHAGHAHVDDRLGRRPGDVATAGLGRQLQLHPPVPGR